MRHGWKTRMDERQYFENKRYEREEKQHIMQLIKMKVSQDLSDTLEQIKRHKDIH